MSSGNETLIISEEEIGLRLDQLLTRQFPSYSRTYFQYLIEEGAVLLNGEKSKKRLKPQIGDEVEVCFLLTPEISLSPEELPLTILYEDEHMLAINKAPGMVVHPAPGHPSGTFVNALLYHCKQIADFGDDLRPGIVHRLDKDTSGVLLAAKTKEMHQKLIHLFSEREIEKTYLAVCVGNPGERTIDAPIGRHPIRRKEMAVIEGGREAISRCRTLAKNEELALVEVQLVTGRTHQARVHLKHINAPVLGDPIYGSASANKKFEIERQLLHAQRIKFTHPIYQKVLELTAEIPPDMQQYVARFQ